MEYCLGNGLELLSALKVFAVCHDTIFFTRKFLVALVEFGLGDLSTANFCLICYVIYQRTKIVQLDVFSLLNLTLHFIQKIQATS